MGAFKVPPQQKLQFQYISAIEPKNSKSIKSSPYPSRVNTKTSNMNAVFCSATISNTVLIRYSHYSQYPTSFKVLMINFVFVSRPKSRAQISSFQFLKIYFFLFLESENCNLVHKQRIKEIPKVWPVSLVSVMGMNKEMNVVFRSDSISK